MVERPLGPVMLDVAGLELTAEERERLAHPLVGGVILFKRNFRSLAQLQTLTAEIRDVRDPALLISVDQEGGRVQRFLEGFTRIPPMREIGRVQDRNPVLARNLARAAGVVIAAELAACGVDFSFAPVLDLDFGASAVIGDRAFHASPLAVAELAGALMDGLSTMGVAAVGKHFPGHGYVTADSHTDVPVDDRDFAAIAASDLVPYRELIPRGLAGIMPAHVVYPKVDKKPAGFSRFWLQDVLRQRLGFGGLIFSDDLSMEGASVAGDVVERGRAAFAAGCDMVLVCNAPDQAARLLDELGPTRLDVRRAQSMRAGSSARGEEYAPSRELMVRELGGAVGAV